MKVAYIDVETTGLDAAAHGIVEVAVIIEIDGEVKATKVWPMNPSKNRLKKKAKVDLKALEINKKTIDEIRDYQASSEVFDEFIELLETYIRPEVYEDSFKIAGYNSQFDMGFIQEWFNLNNFKYNYYFDYKDIDVFALVKYLVYLGKIDTPNHKLETLCRLFDIEHDAHSSLSDIEATHKLSTLLVERFIK